MVQRRQKKVMRSATSANAVVSSLFPAAIQKRLLQDAEDQAQEEKGASRQWRHAKSQLKNFLQDQHATEGGAILKPYATKPIADLFPSTTVMMADLVGFTAWSSVREPSQVFSLLETIYNAFDVIAKRRKVFKYVSFVQRLTDYHGRDTHHFFSRHFRVETIGDCYVAVTGLPEPRKDHAVGMARFATECLRQMKDLVRRLEITLGPDTGELSMRLGLHSGPVIAGVLRGEKARFQLFGDTGKKRMIV
jgi:class 3 adenylate cyclase